VASVSSHSLWALLLVIYVALTAYYEHQHNKRTVTLLTSSLRVTLASISFRLVIMTSTSPNNNSNDSNLPTNNSIPPASNSSSLNNSQGSPANSGNNPSLPESLATTRLTHQLPPPSAHTPRPLKWSQVPTIGITPSGIRLTECTLNKASWPADLVLDLGKSNWIEWSRKLSLLALQQGFAPWLDGSLPCPDATLSPGANFIWKRNDDALRGFIQEYVYPADVHLIELLPTAHLMFETLRAQHEPQVTFAQINLLLKALQIEFTYEKSIRDSVAELRTYYRRILAMGELKEDIIFAVMLLNSMNKHFGPLQQTIMCSSLNLNSEIIVARLLEEDTLIRRRVA
jgi:hypothetical protein